jgi:hypothetical protein
VLTQNGPFESSAISLGGGFIPTPSDQNPCAQSRSPMDMILQG